MQNIWASINPLQTSGIMLASLLDDFKDAIVTGYAGPSRPVNFQAGGMWIDTTNQGAPNYYWAFKLYTGTEDVEIFRISIINGFGGTLMANGEFAVQQIEDSVTNSILSLIKNRVNTGLNNGQILTGDTVAEMRLTGRTNTATDPVVAYIRFTSTDDQTSSASGGTMSFVSAPDSSASLVEYLRFLDGYVETSAAHKLHSKIFNPQTLATAATIALVTASKALIEMTGSTVTSIQAMLATSDSKFVTIHNRSSALVTLKNEHAGATAANRFAFPNSADHLLRADDTVSLYYCTATSRWKIHSAVASKKKRTVERIRGAWQQWTAPTNVSNVRVTSYNPRYGFVNWGRFITMDGNIVMSGDNIYGQLADGTVVPKSSPVIVLGGFKWRPWAGAHYSQDATGYSNTSTIALDQSGKAYAWGYNNLGQLGVGDVIPRSSPVAVVGGLTFSSLYLGYSTNYAMQADGTIWSWGFNGNGMLGAGDTTTRSTPVQVIGGIKFATIYITNNSGVVGIARDGTGYTWGNWLDGAAGTGQGAPFGFFQNSSPVAILGGLKWKKIVNGNGYNGGSGNSVTLGLASDGSAYTWGQNGKGALGQGQSNANFYVSSPVAVLGGLQFVDVFCAQQTAGGNQVNIAMYGLTADGTLYGWGANEKGQLGDGTTVAKSSPVICAGGIKFVDLFHAGAFSANFGLGTDGTLYAWGENGNVGDYHGTGIGTAAKSSPVALIGGPWKHVQPFSNGYSVSGVTVNGQIYVWGEGSNGGELGIGNNNSPSSPTIMLGGHGIQYDVPAAEVSIDVVAGQTYDLVLSQGESKFGNTFIGNNIFEVTLEYET